MDATGSRYYAFIVMITVGLMFTILLNIPQNIRSNNEVLITLVGAVSSVGIYFTFSKILIFLLMRFNWILKIFLGPYYINGTWIGKIRTGIETSKTNVLVEHYEQTLNSLVIRGYSFTPEGVGQADWSTVSAQIDPHEGALYCHYKTNIHKMVSQAEGLGRLQFDRKKKTTGPRGMSGYYIDTHKDKKGYYEGMVKISENLIPIEEAKQRALERLPKENN
jgi:hypothetical protein